VDVVATGDGVVAAKRRDGLIEMWEIDFQGAPAYLSYALFPDRMLVYRDEGYKGRQVRRYSVVGGVAKPDMVSDWPLFIEGEPGKTVRWDNFAIHIQAFDPAEYESVMVMSDGVQSFQNGKTLESVHLMNVVPNLMAFKSYTGEFVTRRCRAFLRRFCANAGWHHNDDLAVAGIYMGEP
jgi:hypothetical protein